MIDSADVRFWLIDLPAFAITWIFRLYAIFIGVMVVLCFGMTTVILLCWALGLPIPWI